MVDKCWEAHMWTMWAESTWKLYKKALGRCHWGSISKGLRKKAISHSSIIALLICKLWVCCILSLPLLNLNRLWAHFSCSEVEFEYFWRLGEVKEVLHTLGGLICTFWRSLELWWCTWSHLEVFATIWSQLEAIWSIWRQKEHIGGVWRSFEGIGGL